MFRLSTLGSVDLRGPDGLEVHAVLAQPKRLALLVYLAAARPDGYHRRDALLALFWPDLDQEHARGALSGALHHLRRALGDESIVTRGSEEVAISHEHLWCDVVALDQALERGESEKALELYRGDLMGAFHVSGCAEFERWLDSERERLRGLATEAAVSLASTAETSGDLQSAVRWARRATALAPYDEELLRNLLRLLDKSGDRAEAIQRYEDFKRELAQELEVEPSAETQALAAEIRAQAVRLEAVDVAPDVRRIAVLQSARRRFSLGKGIVVALAATAIGATVFGFMNGLGSLFSREESEGTVASFMLVADFESRNVDPELVNTVRDLVMVAVDQSPVVAPAPLDMIGRALQSAGMAESTRLDAQVALELAVRYSFVGVVTGRVSRVGNGYAVVLRVLRPEDGSVITSASETAGNADDLIPLLDRLTRIIRERMGESSRTLAASRELEEVTTPSFEAYQEYRLAGEALQRTEGHVSNEHLRAALAVDSGFAMAWRMMAANYANLYGARGDSALYAIEQAVRLSQHRSRPERLHIEAFAAYVRDRDLERAIEIYGQLIRMAPRDLRARFNRGRLLQLLHRYEEALEDFMVLERFQPFGLNAVRAGTIASTLVQGGRHVDELAPYLEWLSPNFRRTLELRAVVNGNDFAAAESIAADALRMSHDNRYEFNASVVLLAAAKAARGAVWEATNTLGIESVEENGFQWTWADHRMALALATGCSTMARIAPMPAWPDTNSFQLRAHAISAVITGDTARARDLLEQEQQRREDERAGWEELRWVLDGLQWAQAGEWAALVSNQRDLTRRRLHFSATAELSLRWLVATGWERLGEPDSAIAYYRRVLDPIALGDASRMNRGFFYPFAHRKLAVLYTRTGDRQAAERHWRDFREVFKSPDPELVWMLEESPLEGSTVDRTQEACASYTQRMAREESSPAQMRR